MNLVLLVAGFFTVGASLISFWLIMRHQQNMSNPSVQSKIVGIIWMIPIYAIDSFLGLWMPNNAEYVNMLRDCYEVRKRQLQPTTKIYRKTVICGFVFIGVCAVSLLITDAILLGLRR